jgi:hypothetical protein
MIKLERNESVGHEVSLAEGEMRTEFWQGNLTKVENLQLIGLDGELIVKLILKN